MKISDFFVWIPFAVQNNRLTFYENKWIFEIAPLGRKILPGHGQGPAADMIPKTPSIYIGSYLYLPSPL